MFKPPSLKRRLETNIIDRLRYLLHIVQAPIYIQYFAVILLLLYDLLELYHKILTLSIGFENIFANPQKFLLREYDRENAKLSLNIYFTKKHFDCVDKISVRMV